MADEPAGNVEGERPKEPFLYRYEWDREPSAEEAEPREPGVIQPCPACGGGGKVVLLTSAKACDVCRGSGTARVQEVLYTRSVWDGDVLRESVDERWIYVEGRLIRKEQIE